MTVGEVARRVEQVMAHRAASAGEPHRVPTVLRAADGTFTVQLRSAGTLQAVARHFRSDGWTAEVGTDLTLRLQPPATAR